MARLELKRGNATMALQTDQRSALHTMLCHTDPACREQAMELLWALEPSERADVLSSSPSLRRVRLQQRARACRERP